MIYLNRQQAGILLAEKLSHYKEDGDVVVYALPRGGVVVGAEIAEELNCPFGVILVRKISHPFWAEYAIGAIAEHDQPIYNLAEISTINKAWLKKSLNIAREVIKTRRALYFPKHYLSPDIKDKIIILVDDGIATGYTMRAALHYIQKHQPKYVVVATPVVSLESLDLLKGYSDRIVLLDKPKDFLGAVGLHYREFEQINDEEVEELLREVIYDSKQSEITETRQHSVARAVSPTVSGLSR